jgi:pimeloyl-ACP methyl ester carboxylesterase
MRSPATRARVIDPSRRRVIRSLAGAAAAFLTIAGQTRAIAQSDEASATPHQGEGAMESVTSPDGTAIAYARGGDGPPLVLVHGTADNHSRWAPVLPALRDRFTVYALDRRGRGGSGGSTEQSYAIEREFADVTAVVEAIGEPAYLLGHSFGAICALEAALQTGNLRALVLYEPPIPIPPGQQVFPPAALEKMERLLEAGDLEGVLITFAREIAQVPEEAIDAMRSMPEWQASVAAAPTIVREVRAVRSYVFDPARFGELSTPTVLLLGSESPPYLTSATEAVATALPRSRVVTLAGQGHLAMDTAPDLFLREVIGFLSEA